MQYRLFQAYWSWGLRIGEKGQSKSQVISGFVPFLTDLLVSLGNGKISLLNFRVPDRRQNINLSRQIMYLVNFLSKLINLTHISFAHC